MGWLPQNSRDLPQMSNSSRLDAKREQDKSPNSLNRGGIEEFLNVHLLRANSRRILSQSARMRKGAVVSHRSSAAEENTAMSTTPGRSKGKEGLFESILGRGRFLETVLLEYIIRLSCSRERLLGTAPWLSSLISYFY